MGAGRWSDKIQPEKVRQIHCFFISEDNASGMSNHSLLQTAGEHWGEIRSKGGLRGGGMRWRNGKRGRGKGARDIQEKLQTGRREEDAGC